MYCTSSYTIIPQGIISTCVAIFDKSNKCYTNFTYAQAHWLVFWTFVTDVTKKVLMSVINCSKASSILCVLHVTLVVVRQVWRSSCDYQPPVDHTHIPQFEWSFFSSPAVSSESVQLILKQTLLLQTTVHSVSATVLVSSFRLVLYGTIS